MALVSIYRVHWRDKSYKDPADRVSLVVAPPDAQGDVLMGIIKQNTGKTVAEFASRELLEAEALTTDAAPAEPTIEQAMAVIDKAAAAATEAK